MTAANAEKPAAGRSDPDQPEWLMPAERPSVNLSLRQIMLLLVYCAALSLVGRYAYTDRTPIAWTGFAVVAGCGVAYLGVWLVARLGSFGYLGWAVFVVGFGLVTGATINILAIPLAPIVVGVLVALHVQHRRNQQGGLLWVLAVAADRQIPLAPGVAAYAQQVTGLYRNRALALADGLRRGQALSAAIGRVNRVVPWDVPLLIRVGEETGHLAEGLRVAAETRSRRHPSIQVVFDRVAYVAIVLVVMEAIVGFTAFFIFPKFEAIFKDMGIGLPGPTRLLFQSGYLAINYVLVVGLLQLAAVAYVLFMLGGRGLQGIPVLGRMFRLRHKSLLLRGLALLIGAGRPLGPGFAVLARAYPSPRLRRRLGEAAESVAAGGDWVEALRGVGLLAAGDVGVLQAASRAGNLPWAIRTLAEAGERRFAYRLTLASQYLFIGAILAIGALVLVVSVALFLPLVEMIERLS